MKSRCLALTVAFFGLACQRDNPAFDLGAEGETSASADSKTSEQDDGDGDGDGDTEPGTSSSDTGDGDGDGDTEPGTSSSDTGDGDGDGDTGPMDTSTTGDGDGDGDPNICIGLEEFGECSTCIDMKCCAEVDACMLEGGCGCMLECTLNDIGGLLCAEDCPLDRLNADLFSAASLCLADNCAIPCGVP